jgi:predicted DNA-binding transcriptional regulator AlpA
VRVHVELPPGPLIDYARFCDAIAEAVSPVSKWAALEGMACIVGKQVASRVPMRLPVSERWPGTADLQGVLLSEDGRMLDQPAPGQGDRVEAGSQEAFLGFGFGGELVEVSLPYALTNDDQRALEAILPDLPLLRFPMSDAEMVAFMEAYRNLRERPAWEPVLITPGDVEQRKIEQAKTLAHHQSALRELFASGQLEVVDHRHAPVKALALGCLIPRAQALAYLERCGLSDDDNAPDADRQLEVRSPTPEPLQAPVAMPSPLVPSDQEAPVREASRASPLLSDVERLGKGKVIRRWRVEELTGLSRSTIDNRTNPDSRQYDETFPKSFRLGESRGAVGWYEVDVEVWIAAQAIEGREKRETPKDNVEGQQRNRQDGTLLEENPADITAYPRFGGPLGEVLTIAWERARDKSAARSVLAAFVELARDQPPPSPLKGASEDGQEVKWLDENGKFQTFGIEQMRSRMRSAPKPRT